MKFTLSYFVTIVLLFLFALTLLWFVWPLFSRSYRSLSPLPDFLTMTKNNQVSSTDVFLPVISMDTRDLNKQPRLSAKSGIVYDMTIGKTLFAKNPKDRLPMASLTKVMTAVIGLENQKTDDSYVIKKEYLVGENVMGLLRGERLALEDLLYGLVLLSGNDAAETIAGNFPKGRESFIDAMNNKAKALGLGDTHFTNPSGLEGDGDQHSSSYDLMVITRYALMNYPVFADVVQTIVKDIPSSNTHQEYYLQNETNLLTSYPGVKGVKTGYTPEAGLCLITYLEYKDHKIIAVLLGSENRRAEMKEILDYSLKRAGITPPKHE